MEESRETKESKLANVEESTQGKEASKHALLGRIISDKPLHRKTVKSMIVRGWGEQEGLSIIDMGTNTFLFSFSLKQKKQQEYSETLHGIC